MFYLLNNNRHKDIHSVRADRLCILTLNTGRIEHNGQRQRHRSAAGKSSHCARYAVHIGYAILSSQRHIGRR